MIANNQVIKDMILRRVAREQREHPLNPIEPYHNGGEDSDKIEISDEILEGAFIAVNQDRLESGQYKMLIEEIKEG